MSQEKSCLLLCTSSSISNIFSTAMNLLLGRITKLSSGCTTLKRPEGQLARWLTSLAEYTFEIVHREGRKHSNADALSRIPCRQCGLLDSSTVNSVNIMIDSIVNENGLINVDEIRGGAKS